MQPGHGPGDPGGMQPGRGSEPLLSPAVIALQFRRDVKACRELFFSQDLPEADLLR